MGRKNFLWWLIILAIWVLAIEYLIITPSIEDYHIRLGEMARNTGHVIRLVLHVCFTFGPAALIIFLTIEKRKERKGELN